MSYTVESVHDFSGGLNLRDAADAVGESEAINAKNVLFLPRGAVAQRPGYERFTATASTLNTRPDSFCPFYTTAGTKRLIAGAGTNLYTLTSTGAVATSGQASGLTQGPWSFARFGSPNNERVYAGNGYETLYRWDETLHWTQPSNAPKARCLAVTPTDNRLVAGSYTAASKGPAGGLSSPSHVYFSDAGDPETWGANNYVQLRPSDGERIQAIVSWREYVYVFKETAYWAYYGTSTDSAGDPSFDFHPVDSGVGLASPRAIAASAEGVYFMDRRGVYRTNGANEPDRLSDKIDPIFLGGSSDWYTGGELNHSQITNACLAAHGRRLYLSFTPEGSDSNERTLVYDPRYEWWTLYDLPAGPMASFRIGDEAELVFGYSSGNNIIGRHADEFNTDDGTAIEALRRSGWVDYDSDSVKKIREAKLWGTGRLYHGISHDFQAGTGDLTHIDLQDPTATNWNTSTWGNGTWAQPATLMAKLNRKSVRGVVFSDYFYNNTPYTGDEWGGTTWGGGTWSSAADDPGFSVHRLAHHLTGERLPTTVKEPIK